MNIAKSKTAILAITPNGNQLAQKIASHFLCLPCDCFTSDKYVTEGMENMENVRGFNGAMVDCVARIFAEYDNLIFICATGIAVRMIAPLIVDKLADPAVLVLDEKGQHVISLLSGHIGGGNALAHQVASAINGTAVITTATDVNNVASLDLIIQSVGADVVDYREAMKTVNQLLVSGKRVGLWLNHCELKDTRGFVIVNDLNYLPENLDYLVLISPQESLAIKEAIPSVHIIPKSLVVGMGCRRDTPLATIQAILFAQLKKHNFSPKAIHTLGSVEIKADEIGLIQLTKTLNVPFKVFSISTLKEYEHHFSISPFVQKTLGIGSVSGPSAWVLSNGNILGDTLKQDGVTVTLGVLICCTL